MGPEVIGRSIFGVITRELRRMPPTGRYRAVRRSAIVQTGRGSTPTLRPMATSLKAPAQKKSSGTVATAWMALAVRLADAGEEDGHAGRNVDDEGEPKSGIVHAEYGLDQLTGPLPVFTR